MGITVKINSPIVAAGHGSVTIYTSTGPIGGLNFGSSGSISFWDLKSRFAINGTAYKLVDGVSGLASAVAANPSGNYALARSYDASQDGTYSAAPIGPFKGTVEGLGNTISNLMLGENVMNSFGEPLAMFAEVDGALRDFRLANASVFVDAGQNGVGASLLVERNKGVITNSYASGTFDLRTTQGANIAAGGIASWNGGQILNSGATVAISADNLESASMGGLAVENSGTVRDSWASGTLKVTRAGGIVGGLVGQNDEGALIQHSWSHVHIIGSDGVIGGGLVGVNVGYIRASPSEANLTTVKSVNVSSSALLGGLVGYQDFGSIDTSYATGSVSSLLGYSSGAGGLVGRCDEGKISRSFASATIHAAGGTAGGGLVGDAMLLCELADVYATGPIYGKGGAVIGGLMGIADSGGSTARAYATGALSAATGMAGGFACQNNPQRE
jgi:hypothetical protein